MQSPIPQVMQLSGKLQGSAHQSAMGKPHPGKTTFVIMVSPLPGKYHLSVFKVETHPS